MPPASPARRFVWTKKRSIGPGIRRVHSLSSGFRWARRRGFEALAFDASWVHEKRGEDLATSGCVVGRVARASLGRSPSARRSGVGYSTPQPGE